MNHTVLILITMISTFHPSLYACDITTDFIYTPERSKNVSIPTSNNTPISSCKLCKALDPNNSNEFPLLRSTHFTVMLNLFPYGQGHLLIIANTHTKALDELTSEQQSELIWLISQSTTILKKELKCPGINVGYNEGRCAGASIVDHFHIHILPRFEFVEKSFVHTISHLQVVQWNFKELQQRLKPFFDDIETV